MGIVEINEGYLTVLAHIITYGNAADEILTERIRSEIETMWNEPGAEVKYRRKLYSVRFRITAEIRSSLQPDEVLSNTDPSRNYFRIEDIAYGNISFVDGLGCNTGYFLKDNLYEGSTTAAHEFGHTLGLDHPRNLDIRGKGIPGIMYPRGTLVDPQFQYNPSSVPGDSTTGGTMHPQYRRVRKQDIKNLDLDKLPYQDNIAVLGWFSSVWHDDHGKLLPGDA